MFTRPLVYVLALIAGPLLIASFANENLASVFLAAVGSLNAPTNLKVTEVTASHIDLKWNDNSNNETGFQIQRKTGSGSFSTIKTVDANTETYRSGGLSSGKKYVHRVRALKGSSHSSYSNEVSTTTLPDTSPTDPWSLVDYASQWKLFNVAGGSVTQLSTGVRLTAPAGVGDIYLMAKTPVDTAQGFQVDFDYTILETSPLPDSGTWTNIGLLRGDGSTGFPVDISQWTPTATLDEDLKAHSAGVRATFANKNADNTSQQNEYRLRTYPGYVSFAPSDATYAGDPKISFTAGVPYHVTFKQVGNVLKLIVTSSAGTQQGAYTSSSFAMPTSRTLFLRHAGGRNGEIKNLTVTEMSPTDDVAPSVPTNLVTSGITTSQIKLAWTPSTDNVGVTGYKIYRNGVQVATATTTPYLNTGLTPATSYTFKVSAYDAAGNSSGQSSGVTATTLSETSTSVLHPTQGKWVSFARPDQPWNDVFYGPNRQTPVGTMGNAWSAQTELQTDGGGLYNMSLHQGPNPPNWTTDTITKGTTQVIKRVTDPVNPSRMAFRFELNKTNPGPSSGGKWRAEFTQQGEPARADWGDHRFESTAILVTSEDGQAWGTLSDPKDGVIVYQYHQIDKDDFTNPPFSVTLKKDSTNGLHLHVNIYCTTVNSPTATEKKTCAGGNIPFTPGQWTYIMVEYVTGYLDQGVNGGAPPFFKVWYANGESSAPQLVVNYTGRWNYPAPDTLSHYAKFGQYYYASGAKWTGTGTMGQFRRVYNRGLATFRYQDFPSMTPQHMLDAMRQ